VGPIANVLFGGGVGVAIVLAFWQLASFADDLYQHSRDEPRSPLGR